MEDAGFIIGGYVLTFVAVSLHVVAWCCASGTTARKTGARRGQVLALTEQNEPTMNADAIDWISPRAPGRPCRVDAARSATGCPLLVLGLVVVAGGVIVTQFLTSAVDYYCNVDEVGQRSGCDEDRRIRLQGTVDEGSVERRRQHHRFTISFNGETMPVSYDGEPGGIFKECIPVVVHGVIEDGTLQGDRVEVKHSDEYVAVNDERVADAEAAGCPDASACLMLFAASINSALGRAGLLLMLAASVFGVLTVLYGIRQHDRKLLKQGPLYAWMAVGGAVLAVVMMQRALITRDFSLAYIQQVGSADTPALYNIAAMWSALEGSILLWALILAAVHRRGRVAVPRAHRRRPRGVGADRDVRDGRVLRDVQLRSGRPVRCGSPGAITSGPARIPLLQNHILVLFHPPILYLGYVGFTVPFAFAIAALVTGRLGEGWLMETRRWALFSWAFLTIGILLGAWWSYEVLGWSGVWAWDPVENASLLPWLTGTAYIHSVLVQERRGMLRVWKA